MEAGSGVTARPISCDVKTPRASRSGPRSLAGLDEEIGGYEDEMGGGSGRET